ncbi:protein adenylyltransferase SelO [Rothia uropygioeca]|uniref:protein adenylyltransferase SelO n=1 Tax=Kocuria sp. 257 TaxID=2021970 RepID=UPI001011901F|nr:YdiU family protein [Kocuria sp. 257]
MQSLFAEAFPELSVEWKADEPEDAGHIVLNEDLADFLGLDPEYLRSPEGLRFLTGAAPSEDSTPVAQGYAGHQFGSYAPRLGDGRALLLGEITASDGRLRDLHLKGSGRTPFARGNADGKAVLGPMLREYLVSEAMYALGIPTTRALAVTTTGQDVLRERILPGAVLARVASSHLRVGTFQYAAQSLGNFDLVRRLVDVARERHGAESQEQPDSPGLDLYQRVIGVQAELIAQWMAVGFVHGVMNTDNMTISGETIDYGPCAFMDAYSPATVFSSIDSGGRYRYGNQPGIAEWNLARLGEALLPVLDDDPNEAVRVATEALQTFAPLYESAWTRAMARKLGLEGASADHEGAETDESTVRELANELLDLMSESGLDFTSTFRSLSDALRSEDSSDALRERIEDPRFDAWFIRWSRLRPNPEAMDRTNPVYIPRNHLVEEALSAANDGDIGLFSDLLDVVTHPFVDRPGYERYAEPAPADQGRYVTYCGT